MQTILAAPQEDSPRLRYANWLDCCGNPLGEFIRLQCFLAHEPDLDRERREQELLAEFREAWAEALEDQVDWMSFRRGFVEEVALTDRQLIRHGPLIFRMTPVLDVHLKTDGRRLDTLPALPGIKHTVFLDVSSQELGDDGIRKLADAPMLIHVHGLNLGSNFISDDGLAALADSPRLASLRELYLNDNPITDEGIRQLVLSEMIDRLDLLDIRHTDVGGEGIENLQGVLGDRLLY
jgi:uncharacterized protein (TIGR02996 family)